jgi:hypothetical protein
MNLEQLAPALVIYEEQLWVKCRSRKSHQCIDTKEPIPKGKGCYRPVGNPSNRSSRLSIEAVVYGNIPAINQTNKGV